MVVTFEEDYLHDLYAKGRCSDKKRRYQPDIVRRYQKAINMLMASSSIQALWKINSLNYACLPGRSSVRVNNQYRIEFTENTSDDIR